jgi:UDP-N-acetylmuramyl pentapeptide phosphotransferase/UDP-N-acetylglucosamine-1-phosphate transferase
VTVAIGVVVGFLAARLVWLALRQVFAVDAFARQNFRGRTVATGGGLVVAVAVLAVEAARTVVAAATGDGSRVDGPRAGVLVLVAGLALVGLVDDLAGDGDRRGFRGHLRAVAEGNLTTGALKLFGGAAVAVVAVAAAGPDDGLASLLMDAAVVALAANLGNLFDRAPGRATKVGAAAWFVLAAATAADPALAASAVAVGAACGLLLDDLRERVMLGDTGANVVGGVVGLGVVVTGSVTTRLAVLAGLAVLNAASEWVSFGSVIDRVAPLRWLDRAGRRR